MKTHKFILAFLGLTLPSIGWAQAAPSGVSCSQLVSDSSATNDIEQRHAVGMTLRARNCAEEALDVFRRLYEQTHEMRALARMALAEQALARYRDAEDHLVEVLRHQSDPWVAQSEHLTQLIGSLSQVRANQRVAILTIHCATPGAQLLLNNAPLPTLGQPMRLPARQTVIEVRAPGFQSTRRIIELELGIDRTETIVLVPVEAAPREQDPPRDSALSVASNQVPRSTTVTETHSHPLRPVAWVALGGAVVGVGLGVVGHVIGQPAADKWNSESMCTAASPTADCVEARNTAESMGVLRAAGFIGGGVLAATSIVFFIVTPPRVETTTRTAFRCAPNLASPGVSCGGRF